MISSTEGHGSSPATLEGKQLILKEADGNESIDMTDGFLPSYTSPVSFIPTMKTASRPSQLFRKTSWTTGAMETDGPVDFSTSKEFAQLLTLPFKFQNCDKSHPGKEYDFVLNSRKHFMPRTEEFKENGDGFKLPSPKENNNPLQSKRMKSALHGHWNSSPSNRLLSLKLEGSSSTFSTTKNSSFPVLGRSHSESAVKDAVEQSSTDPLLLGDCSQRHVLQIISNGKHHDLKEINSSTLVDVINGKYASQINSFAIVDCRYPYEFHGGHIRGAINLYTQKQIYSSFMENKISKNSNDMNLERNIIIFHCEFSSHRAPSLCRYLRSTDRMCNDSAFPALHYPELYVLFGGYKNFYENHGAYCEPQFYRTMLDENHKEDLRLYKSKSLNELAPSKQKSTKRFPRFASASALKQPKF